MPGLWTVSLSSSDLAGDSTCACACELSARRATRLIAPSAASSLDASAFAWSPAQPSRS
jgi:hypothetical protein